MKRELGGARITDEPRTDDGLERRRRRPGSDHRVERADARHDVEASQRHLRVA